MDTPKMKVPAHIAGLSAADKRALLEDLVRRRAGKKAPEARTAPASFAQQRLWFLDQMAPGQSFYNMASTYRFRGRLLPELMERSLNEVIRRHESLRTTFRSDEGRPVQVVAPELKVKLEAAALDQFPEDRREQEAQRLITAEAAIPFDLEAGPLIRARLLLLGSTDSVFLLTTHHIISDGWSLNLIFKEIKIIYAALRDGKQPQLPELPIQYADYAIWQREWLQGEVQRTQLAYWKSKLAGLTTLRLPTDRPRPQLQSYRGKLQPVVIPPPLAKALKAVSQAEGVTPFMTMLAAFQTLLHRYSGQQDIVLGLPIAGRNRAETENLIGLFVNSVILRSNLGGDPTFRELLKRVREVALEAYAHQDLPFEMLVEELQPPRDLSRNPLFQVMFQLFSAPASLQSGSSQEAGPVLTAEHVSAALDLSLDLIEKPEELRGTLVYATDLFDPPTIARLARQYVEILQAAAADPGLRLSQLPPVSEQERRLLVEEWNRTAAPYPRCPVHEVFEKQAEHTPGATAVEFQGERLSYGELNARANRLAHHLRAWGAGPDSAVGVSMERSPEAVCALLAVLKAGAAYVPLDPAYPRERLEFLIADAGVPLLLTRGPAVDLAASVRVLDVSELRRDIQNTGCANPLPLANGDNLAYVIYTSGSTGRPKGVLTPHRALANYLHWLLAAFPLTAEDCVLQKYSLSFDVSVSEMLAPLLAGARLLIAEPGAHLDPVRLIGLMRDHGVTVIDLTPSMLQQLLDNPDFAECRRLRLVFCGGEPLPPALERLFFERMRAELVNMYGPTETTISSTYYRCSPERTRPGVPIGRPIANTRVFVLDPQRSLVPAGFPGELYLGGDGLARGYHARPDLNRESFIPDPFAGGGGERLYRTGDLARYLTDGNLEFLGRADHQVKIRGFRVELGEVEARMKLHRDVADAVAIAYEGPPGGEPGARATQADPAAEATPERRLIAYCVPKAGKALSVAELRRFAERELPAYMIPSLFLILESAPLTAGGKLDRLALPVPENTRPELEESYVPPQTAMERTVGSIWQQVLGVDKVGLHDNFFDLGGHSLLMVRLQNRLNSVLRTHVPIIDLFRYPTVHTLALYLGRTAAQATPFDPVQQRAGKQRELLARRNQPKS